MLQNLGGPTLSSPLRNFPSRFCFEQGAGDNSSTHLQRHIALQAGIILTCWTDDSTQASLPKTYLGINHSGIFITSFNTSWLCGSLSSSLLTVPGLVFSVSQQGKNAVQ